MKQRGVSDYKKKTPMTAIRNTETALSVVMARWGETAIAERNKLQAEVKALREYIKWKWEAYDSDMSSEDSDEPGPPEIVEIDPSAEVRALRKYIKWRWRRSEAYDSDMSSEDSDEPGPPEIVEIDPPEGTVCRDHNGSDVNIGDTVRVELTGREFTVRDIMYYGFEDRSDADMWDEPGYMLGDENGFNHASGCVKV